MRILMTVNLIVSWVMLFGQHEYIFSAYGGSFSSDEIKIDWTMGDLATDHFINEEIQIEEGFLHLFNEDLSTAIANITLDAGVSLFPNPVSHYMIIEIENADVHQLKIFDATGKMIYRAVVQEQLEIVTTHWEQGSYFLLIEKDGKQGLYPFIKL